MRTSIEDVELSSAAVPGPLALAAGAPDAEAVPGSHQSISEPSDEAIRRLHRKLKRNLGPLVVAALDMPDTIEVMLNPDGTLWHERLGFAPQHIGVMRKEDALAALNTVAMMLGEVVNRKTPLLEGELPLDGSRFAGQVAPVVVNPSFSIRRKASAVFTLDQYVSSGVLTQSHCDVLRHAIREHQNIVVVGGTSSGKTTLLNAVLAEMTRQFPEERLVLIEDTRELQCTAPNAVAFRTSRGVTMTELLRTALRVRPDRILVGEVRGQEALDMADAWNTGHPGGAASIHANSPEGGLARLRSLISRHPSAPRDIDSVIGEVVDLIVFMAKVPDKGRRVLEVLRVNGHVGGTFQTQSIN